MPMRKPPVRKLRHDRRITVIVPADLVPAINADLAAGWTISGVIVAALRLAYIVEGAPGIAPVAPRNGPKASRKP